MAYVSVMLHGSAVSVKTASLVKPLCVSTVRHAADPFFLYDLCVCDRESGRWIERVRDNEIKLVDESLRENPYIILYL